MPPTVSAVSSAPSRNSFYSRRRTDSANSTSSSSSKGKSTSSRSTSPLAMSRQQAAVLAAANNAAKRPAHNASASSQASSSSVKLGAVNAQLKRESRSLLHEDEYQAEVIEHMHHMETQTMASTELMDVQPELRWFMRPYLVDFLIEIHQTFHLRPETLYLTMNVVDRYVSKRIVYKRHYQLVGCAALLIASKFEDSKDRVPTVHELSQMCCNAYDESAFTQMEGHVLSTIGWALGHPTAEAWLRLSCTSLPEEAETQNTARFLMEVSLFHREFISITPSILASGALMLARYICGKESRSFQNAEETAKAAQLIDAHVKENMQDLSLILVKKYSYHYYSSASTIVREWYMRHASGDKAVTTGTTDASGLLPAQMLASNVVDAADDDDDSMCSRSTTPSSLMSTPSRSAEGDDDDMPVTPLSLYSLHDPLAAAAAAIHGKENGGAATMAPSDPSCMKQRSQATKMPSIAQPAARVPLRTAQWDCNMQH